MTDTDRLAALMVRVADEMDADIHPNWFAGFAARLVMQGVRVGDDAGLRALLVKWRDAALDGDASMLGDLVDETNAALAASPTPTLDRERLARAVRDARHPKYPEDGTSYYAARAAAIADAYEADDA